VKRIRLFAAALLAGLVPLAAAEAATLRWASRGDAQSMDPSRQTKG